MSLSKQLYIIISFIFFMIFIGNFIISVKNTKEYLEVESTTKAQDTAHALGMSFKSIIKDKKDPEIELIIKAIANRGFYKEIRLEDTTLSISDTQLINLAKLSISKKWEILNINVHEKFGEIIKNDSDFNLGKELSLLENVDGEDIQDEEENTYEFIANKNYKNIKTILVNFTAKNDKQIINTSAIIPINKILVQVIRSEKFDYIPAWFIDLIPITLEEQKSEITDGWKTTAILYVSANAGDAYAKLYEQAKGAVIYALFAFVISMMFLFIFIRFLLKPLKEVENLAKNISKGKFGTIKDLSWTTEIKNVTLAMNDMSSKIENMISKLNSNLENMTKKLSVDTLTNLQLKQSFETDLKSMFMNKDSGYIFTIKINDLAQYAKTHTNTEVNNFIKNIALILTSIKIDKVQTMAYRFYGSEFALIAKNADENNINDFLKILKDNFTKFGKTIQINEIAHIGGTPFNKLGTIPQMLLASNEAYEKAKQIGPNEFHIGKENDLIREIEDWKELVVDIVDKCNFNVDYIGDAYTFEEGDTLVMQEAFTSTKDKENNDIPIGTFVSIAEQYNKIIDFDKAVITKVISYIKANDIKHSISINLSLESMINDDFTSWLKSTIIKNKSIANQFVFSITAYAVAKNTAKFIEFSTLIHTLDSKIIIKRFETKFISLDNIQNFNLDYIRLARDYTNNISEDPSKMAFVESIHELTKLLNIKIFAENVKNEKDFEIIKKINIYGASR